MQQLGAVPIKQAVYALPDTPGTREDFEWLKAEVKAAGGDASVFAADHVDTWSDDALVEEFRRAGQEAYAALAGDIEKVLKRASAARRPRGTRAPATRRLLDLFRERLTAIEGEAPTIGTIVEGLQLAHPDDEALLAQGMTLFDSLYRSFEHASRSAGPRALAQPRKSTGCA